jgi:hypothetical protein
MIPTKKLSKDKILDVNIAISRKKKISKKVCIPKICIPKVQKQLIASYGARMRGCVFRIDFS